MHSLNIVLLVLYLTSQILRSPSTGNRGQTMMKQEVSKPPGRNGLPLDANELQEYYNCNWVVWKWSPRFRSQVEPACSVMLRFARVPRLPFAPTAGEWRRRVRRNRRPPRGTGSAGRLDGARGGRRRARAGSSTPAGNARHRRGKTTEAASRGAWAGCERAGRSRGWFARA